MDTLKRTVKGEREMRAFESEQHFLERVADVCDLPVAFFYVDFDRLERLLADPTIEPIRAPLNAEEANSLRRAAELLADLARKPVLEAQPPREASGGQDQPGPNGQAPPPDGE